MMFLRPSKMRNYKGAHLATQKSLVPCQGRLQWSGAAGTLIAGGPAREWEVMTPAIGSAS